MSVICFTLSSGKPLLLELRGERVTIGREPDNQLVVPEETVSSHHGVFTRQGDGYIFQDSGSTNGSKINGNDILFGVLQPGDRLMLGTCEGIYEPGGAGMLQDSLMEKLCQRLARGDATAIHVFPAGQEANARAQAKLCRAWAAKSSCPLDVLLLQAVEATAAARFLLVESGTLEAQWQLTAAVADPSFPRWQKAVLTRAESKALQPVECHENFPQPGATLPNGEGFLTLQRQIARRAYRVADDS